MTRAEHMVESNKKRRGDAGIALDKPKGEPVEASQEALGDAEDNKSEEDEAAGLNPAVDRVDMSGEPLFVCPS